MKGTTKKPTDAHPITIKIRRPDILGACKTTTKLTKIAIAKFRRLQKMILSRSGFISRLSLPPDSTVADI
jgi:hypothetical protein